VVHFEVTGDTVAALGGHYGRSPDRLSDEEIQSYLLALGQRGLAFSTINVAVSSLRLFYGQVLKRPMDALKEVFPRSGNTINPPFFKFEQQRAYRHILELKSQSPEKNENSFPESGQTT